jgi:LPXTG-site transpeptidase (sortase) family protein
MNKGMGLVSKLLLTTGILLVLVADVLTYQRTNPSLIAFEKAPVYTTISQATYGVEKGVKAVRITSADLKIDLPLVESKVRKSVWETTTQGASHLDLSPVPGDTGNSVIYGHNWPKLMGNLTHAKPGTEIDITLENGVVRRFRIEKTAVLSPKDYSVLLPSKNKLLTLYTCTGFLDSKRFVATASLISDLSKK